MWYSLITLHLLPRRFRRHLATLIPGPTSPGADTRSQNTAVVLGGLCLLCTCGQIVAESVSIVSVPAKLPKNTSLGLYSQPILFQYGGLTAGARYTLRVWLLEASTSHFLLC